jgi:DNA-directed RNA polymerase
VKAEWLRQNASRIAPEVYEGVNFIQSTPYRINRRVLEVVDDLKISGMAKLPDGTMPKLKLPPKPWKTDQEFAVLKENNPEKVKAWSQKAHKRLRLGARRPTKFIKITGMRSQSVPH